jgi:hypothetical protein
MFNCLCINILILNFLIKYAYIILPQHHQKNIVIHQRLKTELVRIT